MSLELLQDMRPAPKLQPPCRLHKDDEAGIVVSLQDARELAQMPLGMHALAVCRVGEAEAAGRPQGIVRIEQLLQASERTSSFSSDQANGRPIAGGLLRPSFRRVRTMKS
jgi:hypothetical protein